MTDTGAVPDFSVTVPTRGRAEHLASCVASILACTGPSFELIVVDQSDDRASEEALQPLLADPRLRYVRSDTRGVCAARNVGIAASRAPLLACTDDDCRVSSDWLAELARAFADDPRADILCGKVDLPVTLWEQGFGAYYPAEYGQTTWATLRTAFTGITANLAMRRDVAERLRGFDVMLGAGAPLRSGGEPDLFFRALRAELRIVDAPRALVVHLGVRQGAALSVLFRRYKYGEAAAWAKHVRCGDVRALGLWAGQVFHWSVAIARGVVSRGSPRGMGALLSLLQGFAASFRFRIDRHTRLYVPN